MTKKDFMRFKKESNQQKSSERFILQQMGLSFSCLIHANFHVEIAKLFRKEPKDYLKVLDYPLVSKVSH